MDLVICITDWFFFFELIARKPKAKCVVHQYQVCIHLGGMQLWLHTWSIYTLAIKKNVLAFHLCCFEYSFKLLFSLSEHDRIKTSLLNKGAFKAIFTVPGL